MAPCIHRLPLEAGERTAVTPRGATARHAVNIGNTTAGDLQVDFGDPDHYAIIGPGGWHPYTFSSPTPQGSLDGISFFLTAAQAGVVVLEWS